MKDKKKVWIITRRAGHNFGSSLQAYALQHTVEKLGFKNEIINYDEYYHNIKWRIRPFINDCLFRVMHLIPALSKLIAKNKYKWLFDRNTQQVKFEDFERDNLTLTKKEYKTSKAIGRAAKDCDICICGSDQIWSPLLFDPTLFLDFCDKDRTKTVAYAPSFGINTIEQNRDQIKNLIESIHFISVREETGSDIIKELTHRDAPVVLDPTLLLDRKDWSKIASHADTGNIPYILCYFLGGAYIPYQFIEDLKNQTGYRIINICTYRTLNSIQGECISDASPAEFITYIANAAYVCTDSFHGTIFSILFERQFFTFERFGNEKENQNSRIYTLLKACQVPNRLIPYDSIPSANFPVINFELLKINLENARAGSIKYLETALN